MALNTTMPKSKSISSPEDIIQQMIALQTQQAVIEAQISDLRPAFFEACAQYDSNHIEHNGAFIYRKLTRGTWTYPDDIINYEQHLKKIKLEFRQTHEPTDGREISWIIKLLPS
jgi:hypothetical protein